MLNVIPIFILKENIFKCNFFKVNFEFFLKNIFAFIIRFYSFIISMLIFFRNIGIKSYNTVNYLT